MSAFSHAPVMSAEMVAALRPAAGEIFVDGTFGGGGHTKALLAAAVCRVYGIDRDPEAVAVGQTAEANYGGRFKVIHGRFGDMEDLLAAAGVRQVHGVALDLGVSSRQLDFAERGFSFAHDGPLDMRMGRDGASAAELVNSLSESELADTIHRYGEERRAKAVAREIVRARAIAPIRRTAELAAVVARAVRGGPGLHPATRTFQALRIRVNDELGELHRGLCAAERLLLPEGRLAVLAFHSLEDRIVKRFLSLRSGRRPTTSRHLPPLADATRPASFRLQFNGARRPGAAETAANPRARSARLRAAERTAAPPWPQESFDEAAA
jgi:16S rRNA (cytosine1402-N4)-methyltransferase